MIDSNGKAFNKADENRTYDVNLYHPNTKYINGRPDWLQKKSTEAVAITSKVTIRYPCLILAYVIGESIEEAVPVDIIELKSKTDSKKLLLNTKTKHTLVIKNRQGQRQILNL